MVANSIVFSCRTFKFGLLLKLRIGSVQTSLKDFRVQDPIFLNP